MQHVYLFSRRLSCRSDDLSFHRNCSRCLLLVCFFFSRWNMCLAALLFSCERRSGYRYKSIEHRFYSSINVWVFSGLQLSFRTHRKTLFVKYATIPACNNLKITSTSWKEAQKMCLNHWNALRITDMCLKAVVYSHTHTHPCRKSINVTPIAPAPEDAASARAALNARAQIKTEQQR